MVGSNRTHVGGEAIAIVQTLREFGRNEPVPTGLVARAVGRAENEIADSLTALAASGVIEVVENRRGRCVKLVKS